MIALDTNVLIYACDKADPARQATALELISNARDGITRGKSRVNSSRLHENWSAKGSRPLTPGPD
jgi:predicted nucleic acid-binding protein